jgi:hypothetical protein
MIVGLRLTMTGEELKSLLERRTNEHHLRAECWRREKAQKTEEQADVSLCPEHICDNEAARHEWRAEVLSFLRDHIEAAEVYRLGEADLEFGELLPEKPDWMQQEEYEASFGFSFGGGANRVGSRTPMDLAYAAAQANDETLT